MKNLNASIAIGLVLLAAYGAAYGADAENQNTGPFRPGWYAAPALSLTKADKERQTGDGLGFVLAIGHRGDFASLELAGILTTLGDGKNGSDAKLSGGQLALVAGPFFEGEWLSRFFGVVGFGVFQRENHPRYDKDVSTIFGDAGIGYLYPFKLFGFDLAARGEVRYRYDVQQPPRPAGTPSAFQDTIFNLGVQVPLSPAEKPVPSAKPAPVTVVPPVSADDDKDGVPDDLDQCPGTLADAAIDDRGCTQTTTPTEPAAKPTSAPTAEPKPTSTSEPTTDKSTQ